MCQPVFEILRDGYDNHGTKLDQRGGNMKDELQLLRKIIPDMAEEMVKRYRILKTVKLLEPCGRRLVVLSLGMTERTVRSEIEKLNAQGLVKVSKTGMSVTEEGTLVLDGLHELFGKLTGMAALEEKIKSILGAQRVMLAQGDCEESDRTAKEMAHMGARALLDILKRNSRVAITGGSTMANLVDAIPDMATKKAEMILPARGSVGRKLELQADTLAAKIAEKIGAEYRMLHLPDNLSQNVLEEMKREPEVAETIAELQCLDILMLGVGDAMEMAEKRRLDGVIKQKLKKENAVAEACGYYFNCKGEVVYETNSIGVDFSKVHTIKNVIVSAGGKKKAACLLALSKSMSNAIFVLDEGAALEMLRLIEQ